MNQPIFVRTLIIICVVAIVVGIGNLTVHHAPHTASSSPKVESALSSAQKTSLASITVPSFVPVTKPTSAPSINAKAYIVLDPDTKYPLAQKNADLQVPIASTTK